MPRRPTSPDLVLSPRPPAAPAGHWLSAALREAILDGRLRPGARLPTTRDLARRYGLARGTIVGAFERLAAEGYLEGRVGSGTYVARLLPDQLLKQPDSALWRGPGASAPHPGTSRATPGESGNSATSHRGRSGPSAPTSRRWTSSRPHSGPRSRVGGCGRPPPTCCSGLRSDGLPAAASGGGGLLATSRGVRCAAGRWPSSPARRRRSTSRRGCCSSPATAPP